MKKLAFPVLHLSGRSWLRHDSGWERLGCHSLVLVMMRFEVEGERLDKWREGVVLFLFLFFYYSIPRMSVKLVEFAIAITLLNRSWDSKTHLFEPL